MVCDVLDYILLVRVSSICGLLWIQLRAVTSKKKKKKRGIFWQTQLFSKRNLRRNIILSKDNSESVHSFVLSFIQSFIHPFIP
jgi:hypothetical protein